MCAWLWVYVCTCVCLHLWYVCVYDCTRVWEGIGFNRVQGSSGGVLVSSLSPRQNIWANQLGGRKDEFQLTISEILADGHITPLLLDLWRGRTSGQGARGRRAQLITSWCPGSKGRGRRRDPGKRSGRRRVQGDRAAGQRLESLRKRKKTSMGKRRMVLCCRGSRYTSHDVSGVRIWCPAHIQYTLKYGWRYEEVQG